MTGLSELQLASYNRDGFLGPVDAIGAGETAELRASVEVVERAQGVVHYIVKPTILLTAADRIGPHRQSSGRSGRRGVDTRHRHPAVGF